MMHTHSLRRFAGSLGVGIAVLGVLGHWGAPAWGQSASNARLRAPFHVGGDDGLNILVLVPEMESAISLGEGAFRLELGSDLIDNDFKDTSGLSYYRMRGSAIESHFRMGYGLLEPLDLTAEFTHLAFFGSIRGVNDGESFFTADADAHAGVTDPVFALKYQFHQGKEREGTGLAVRVASKMPLGSKGQIHSTGAFDVAASLLGSLEFERGTFHANVGYTKVGEQEVFRPEADVDLKNVVSFGAGYFQDLIEGELAVGGQVIGYTNPFRDVAGEVDGFHGAPVSAVVGVRYFGNEYLSVDLGTMIGITPDATDFGMFLNLVVQN